MNTLYNILNEIVSFVPLINVSDWLVLNDKNFYSFSFIRFKKENCSTYSKCNDLRYLMGSLLYFDFVKKNKKLISSNFDLIQFCCTDTFFKKSISYYVKILPTCKNFSVNHLKIPIKKLFNAILISKKAIELKRMVIFWKKYHLKLMIVEVLNQPFQENIKKKMIENIETEFKYGRSRKIISYLYILKKRLKCAHFKLVEKIVYSIDKIPSNAPYIDSNFFISFLVEPRIIRSKKNLKICLNLINFFLHFRPYSLSCIFNYIGKFFLNYLINMKKEYLLKIEYSKKIGIFQKNKNQIKICNCFILNECKIKNSLRKKNKKIRISVTDTPFISLI